jgi:Ca2+-transporting ATPase
VAAIEEGRIIFENIRKVVAYTLSNSFAEVLTIFMAMLFNWPAPLAVAQIL